MTIRANDPNAVADALAAEAASIKCPTGNNCTVKTCSLASRSKCGLCGALADYRKAKG